MGLECVDWDGVIYISCSLLVSSLYKNRQVIIKRLKGGYFRIHFLRNVNRY
jgi:hypothetical protein